MESVTERRDRYLFRTCQIAYVAVVRSRSQVSSHSIQSALRLADMRFLGQHMMARVQRIDGYRRVQGMWVQIWNDWTLYPPADHDNRYSGGTILIGCLTALDRINIAYRGDTGILGLRECLQVIDADGSVADDPNAQTFCSIVIPAFISINQRSCGACVRF